MLQLVVRWRAVSGFPFLPTVPLDRSRGFSERDLVVLLPECAVTLSLLKSRSSKR